MKENIKYKKVEGIYVAISIDDDEKWNVYLINKNNHPISNALISSKGYGELNNEYKKTSVLRHHVEKVEANSFALIEPIDPSLFQLTNEFMVSYYIDKQIYDKKYIFTPASFFKENWIDLPFIESKGILHK